MFLVVKSLAPHTGPIPSLSFYLFLIIFFGFSFRGPAFVAALFVFIVFVFYLHGAYACVQASGMWTNRIIAVFIFILSTLPSLSFSNTFPLAVSLSLACISILSTKNYVNEWFKYSPSFSTSWNLPLMHLLTILGLALLGNCPHH